MRLQSKNQAARVVILGAGYAGQIAAARLAKQRPAPEITVIDASPTFVERIRLHQVAAGQEVPALPMQRLLPRRARFLQGRAIGVRPAARCVEVEAAAGTLTVPYDYLVYALGSTVDQGRVPGAATHTRALGSRDMAATLQAELPALARQRGRLLVVGGGLTGIEAACELAETYPGLRVTLASSSPPGAGLSDKGRGHLLRAFARLGIAIRQGVQAQEVQPGALRCTDGEVIPFDHCLWAAGFRVPDLARRSGLPVTQDGQIRCERTLRMSGHPEIFAAGDAAAIAEAPLRMACATAMPMGAHAADQIGRLLRGQAPLPFRFGFVAQCISLGRRDAIVQLVDPADRPARQAICGWAGAPFKEPVCRFTVWVIRLERRLGVPVYTWPRPVLPAGTAV